MSTTSRVRFFSALTLACLAAGNLATAAEIAGISHDIQLSTDGQTFRPALTGADAVDPGQTVTVRLVYDNRTSAAVTSASVRALLDAGFSYVPGTTRNCITPASGEIVCNDSPGQAGQINEASVWSSSTDLTISPTAGLYDIDPGQRQGVFEMGKKRYLNFQNCDYALVNGWNTDDIYGFQPGNVRIDTVTCGPGGNGTYYRPAQSLRNVVDLIARRYANMQDCDYALTNNLNTDDAVNFAPSNTPFTALTCGTSTDPNVYYRAANSLFAAGDHLGRRYLNFSDCDYINLSNNNTDDVVNLYPSNTPLTSYVCGGAAPGTAFRAQNSMFDPLDLLDTARGSGYIQFRMRAPQNPGVYTVTSTVSGNGISAVTDTAQVEVRGGNNTCSARNEYTMTLSSSFYYSPLGQASGSATACTSASPGAGWTLTDQECLISGGPCYTQVCLWRRPTAAALEYTMTHAGGNYPNSLSCATTPPAGYSLKARGCAANNSVAPHYCFSDVCLWEKSGTAADLLLSHAGSNGTAVDCRQSSPGAGYTPKAQVCILSNGPCFSDLCLWQKANSCTPPAAACSDTLDNDNDNLADSQDPGCHTDGNANNPNSYNPNDNDEFHQQSCQMQVSLGAAVNQSNSDYNGRQIDGSLLCPNGYIVTEIAYKDSATGNSDAMDGLTLGCTRLLPDGSFGDTLPLLANTDIDTNPRFLARFGCPAGQAYVGIRQKDSPVNSANSDILDGIAKTCAPVGPFGVGQLTAAEVHPDLSQNSRDLVVHSCPFGHVLVGVRYDRFGNSYTAAADGTDSTERVICRPVTTQCLPPTPVAQCSDGNDNDNDNLTDSQDPGCHTDGNANNPNSYNPNDNDEFHQPLPPPPECRDGSDNDNDNLTDFPADPGCTSANDDDEQDQTLMCQPEVSGIANTYFFNGNANSQVTHVTLPRFCANPSVVTQSIRDSVLCGTGAGPRVCANSPGTTSTDLHSYVSNVTSTGFDVFVSGDDGVWVGAVSPAFPVAYQVSCGEPNVPLCSSASLVSGVANVGFYNGRPHSETARVNLPAGCGSPVVVTQSYRDSILCGTGAGPTACVNNPGTTSADLKSYPANVSPAGFDVFLSADDNVWVGATSPAFPIAYHAMCQNPVGGNRTAFAGVTSTVFFNGTSHSQFKHVTFPQRCQQPSVITQTYKESVACGTGAGPATCVNNPATSSTDLHAYPVNITENGMDVFLSGDDNVWVGAVSPAFPIAYHVTCAGDVPPPAQCSDGADNDGDTKTDSQDPGCHTDGNANNPNSYDPTDNNEFNQQAPQCSDGIDNLDPEDALADANDPGCHFDNNPNNPNSYNPNDDDERNQQQVLPQCSDGIDNADTEDTLADEDDPGCHFDNNPNNPNSYNPNDNNEFNQPQTSPQCSDGLDNDHDYLIDIYDPGCHSDGNFSNPNTYDPNDASESNVHSSCPFGWNCYGGWNGRW